MKCKVGGVFYFPFCICVFSFAAVLEENHLTIQCCGAHIKCVGSNFAVQWLKNTLLKYDLMAEVGATASDPPPPQVTTLRSILFGLLIELVSITLL